MLNLAYRIRSRSQPVTSFNQKLESYAELAVKFGVNLQDGQTLVIKSQLNAAPLVRLVAEKAYQAGAGNVHVQWADEPTDKLKLNYAPEDTLKKYPQWIADGHEELAKEGAAFLFILAPYPGILADVDPDRVALATKARQVAMRSFNQYMMSSSVPWCIVAYANEEWAASVFPDLSPKDAVDKLWDHIFYVNRMDQADPIAAWKKHIESLQERMAYLNEAKFTQLHYRAPGTDLKIELPKGHIWLGGGDTTPEGVKFMPNMPTEEVFTLPKRDGANGTVTSTMPLSYGGQVIKDFSFTFEKGRIVQVTAKQGEETLKKLIDTDEGARYLGEVALVPNDSPISNLDILFEETLFDENASNHLAIGQAYSVCLEGGTDMSQDELVEHGANVSLAHVDFMIGCAEMDIDAQKPDDTWVPLFRKGNWAR
jgi:aminopeptidase